MIDAFDPICGVDGTCDARYDAFVAQLDANGVPTYATYLGGIGDEVAYGIAIDPAGKVYVTGYTKSGTTNPTWNFPTRSAYQSTCVTLWPSCFAGFIARFDLSLSGSASLEYSSYLDGDGNDIARGIAVDAAENMYVTGSTTSSNVLPTARTPNGFADAFVARLNASGTSLTYGVYLGEKQDEGGNGIALDTLGNAYIVGSTSGEKTLCGDYDSFVAQISPTGTVHTTTCLGGSAVDTGHAIAVERPNIVLITGSTYSTDFPTKQPLRPFNSSGEAFVARLDLAADAADLLLYSTALGGSAFDSGTGIAVDSGGNAYVVGRTTSTDFLLLPDALQATYGGDSDGFVVKLNPHESPVKLTIQDTTGADVSALGLNADGWPALNATTGAVANPITATVTLHCPEAGGTCYRPFSLDIGFKDTPGRFYVASYTGAELIPPIFDTCFAMDAPMDTPGATPSRSYYSGTCNFITLTPGQSVELQWLLWIQPSEAAQLTVAAEYGAIDTARKTLTIPKAAITPIVFLPGLGATIPPTNDGNPDLLLALANRAAEYNAFYTALERMGYEKGRTYFLFPYDWLQTNLVSAQFLKQRLTDWATPAANVPWVAGTGNAANVDFDLVGHSTGNLVTRTYVQGPAWTIDNVRRWVSIAGPLQGLTKGYKALEGATPELEILDAPTMQIWIPVRAEAAGYPIDDYVRDELPVITKETEYQFIHDPVKGVTILPEFLPTAGYGDYITDSSMKVHPFGCLANPLLEDASVLTGSVADAARVSNWMDQTDLSGLYAMEGKVFDPYTGNPYVTSVPAGFTTQYRGFNTPAKMQELEERIGANNICLVYGGDPDSLDSNARLDIIYPQPTAPYWLNGTKFADLLDAGDKIIPAWSAAPPDSMWVVDIPPSNRKDVEDAANRQVNHTSIVGEDITISATTQCLTGIETLPFLAETYRPSSDNGNQRSASMALPASALASATITNDTEPTNRALLIYANGPVELMLTNAQGQRLGYDPATSDILTEIDTATYYRDTTEARAYLFLVAPEPADYTITVTGISAGDYEVYGWYADATARTGLLYEAGTIAAGQSVSIPFTLPSAPTDVSNPPDVQAGWDRTTTVNQPVTFTGAFSDINPGDTHTIDWDFGDGATASGTLTPTHTYTSTGVYTVTLTVTDNTGFVVSDTLQVQVTGPGPSTPDLAVQYRVGESGSGSANNSDIKPILTLVNRDTTDIPLSALTVRYWYTIDTDQPQTYACDWAVVNCANITHQFVTLPTPRDGADHYLELGFTSAAGTLPAGGSSGEIQSRVTKADYSNYDETNDYSFDPTKTSFTDWTQVTLYHNGVLVWGTEPAAAVSSGLAVQYQVGENGSGSATNSDIKPVLALVNTGTTAVPLSELTVRYWYTTDTTQPQTYACDWAVVDCANLTHQFVALTTPRDGADHYLELGFTSAAGTLPGGGSSGAIQSRITNADFSPYDETDDYSFDPTKTNLADWTHVTLYRNGVLVWGTEPH